MKVRRVGLDELRRGDFIIVRWRDASDTRGFMEEFGETCSVELVEEIWLVIPCEESKEMVPELRFKGRRIRTRRYDRDEFKEEVIQGA